MQRSISPLGHKRGVQGVKIVIRFGKQRVDLALRVIHARLNLRGKRLEHIAPQLLLCGQGKEPFAVEAELEHVLASGFLIGAQCGVLHCDKSL